MADDRVNNREPQRTQPAAVNQGNRILPSSQLGRSPFMRLLDQTKLRMDQAGTGPQTSTTTPQEAAHHLVEAPQPLPQRDGNAHQETANRFKDREREKDSDKDEPRSRSSQDSGLPQAKVAERRVIARGALSERDQGGHKGGGQNQGGASGQSRRGKEFAPLFSVKEGVKGKAKDLSQTSFATRLSNAAKLATGPLVRTDPKPQVPQVLSKELIDQIVQYVRLVIRKDGEKELDLSLHEKVFKGLQLRVAVVRGKVEATFVTQSAETRDLFIAQKGALREALAEKGIDVRQIDVIMA